MKWAQTMICEYFGKAMKGQHRSLKEYTVYIAHIEYGNGLYMLYGDARLDEVSELYEHATELTARDAVEKLDIESALAEFE